MTKFLLILLIGLVCESTGIVLLKQGMTQMGEMHGVSASEILRMAKAGVTSSKILLGVFFQALFFGCLLVLMSRSDISFLWPLTALSFVFATFAAIWFLGEQVSATRWIGIVLIVIGAGFISYSEHVRPKPLAPAAQSVNPAP